MGTLIEKMNFELSHEFELFTQRVVSLNFDVLFLMGLRISFLVIFEYY